jgi:hypothetical protein
MPISKAVHALPQTQNGTALHEASQIPGSGGSLPIFLPKEARRRSRGAISPGHSSQLEWPIRVFYQLPKLVIRFDYRRSLYRPSQDRRLTIVRLMSPNWRTSQSRHWQLLPT